MSNTDKNDVTYVNTELMAKKANKKASFKELHAYFKGAATSIATFVISNKLILFLGGLAEDDFIYWLGQQSALHPELAGVIKVVGKTISVAWNALVADPVLWSLVASALVSFGVMAVWGVKNLVTNKKAKAGVVSSDTNTVSK